MEVSLLETVGLPPDCLISVRAGTTRRQAPADDFKLLFPRSAPFASQVKVDFLAPLGSAVLELVEGTESYSLDVGKGPGGAAMRATLRVRHAEPGGYWPAQQASPRAQGATGAPSPSSRHRQALEARAYLDEHCLLNWLQDLMQALINEKPADPWAYIMALIARETGRLEMPARDEKAPASMAATSATTAATTAPESPSYSATVEAREGAAAAAPAAVELTPAQMVADEAARSSLVTAGGSSAAGATPAESLASLPGTSRAVSPTPRERRRSLPLENINSARSCRTSSPLSSQLRELRAKLRSTLSEACRSGELGGLAPQSSEDAEETESLAALKAKARGVLEEAGRNGQLAEVMLEANSESSRPCTYAEELTVPSIAVIGAAGLPALALAEGGTASATSASALSSARSEWSAATSQADGPLPMEPVRVRPGDSMLSPLMLTPMSVPITPQTGPSAAWARGPLLRPPAAGLAAGTPLGTRSTPSRALEQQLAEECEEGSEELTAVHAQDEARESAAGKQLEEETEAATRIQAAQRGRVARQQARQRLSQEAEAATRIQAAQRGRAARRQARGRLSEETEAATRIQAAHRGRVVRKQAQQQFEEETEAAKRIQAAHRGQVARKLVQRQLEEETEAAKRIQAAHRGQVARKQVQRQLDEETEAATRIQAVHRGQVARKQVQQQLEEEAQAAVRAQALEEEAPAAAAAPEPRRPASRELRQLAAREVLESMLAGDCPPAQAGGSAFDSAAGGRAGGTRKGSRRSATPTEAAEQPRPPAVPCPVTSRPEPPQQAPISPAALGVRSHSAPKLGPCQQAPQRSPSKPMPRSSLPLPPLPLGSSPERRPLEASQRSASLPAPSQGPEGRGGLGSSGGLSTLEQLEARLRERADRTRQDNSALRQENARLRQVRETGDKAWEMHRENERLRAELGKLLSFSRR